MHYINKIIDKARPIVHKIKIQETKQNKDFYQGYENMHKIINEEIFMLLVRITINGKDSICKKDYERMKNYCKSIKKMEQELRKLN